MRFLSCLFFFALVMASACNAGSPRARPAGNGTGPGVATDTVVTISTLAATSTETETDTGSDSGTDTDTGDDDADDETDTGTGTDTETDTSTDTGTGTGDASDPDVDVESDLAGFSMTGLFRDIKLTSSRFTSLTINDQDDLRVGGVIRVDVDGDSYVMGFQRSGEIDTTFGVKGRRITDYSGALETETVRLLVDDEGGDAVGVVDATPQKLAKIDFDTGVMTAFNTVVGATGYVAQDAVDWLTSMNDGTVLVARGAALACLSVDGVFCLGFGTGGLIAIPVGTVAGKPAAGGTFVVAGEYTVRRYDAVGLPVGSFGTSGESDAVTFTIFDMAVTQGTELIYLLGRTGDSSDYNYIARLDATGTLDAGFGTGGVTNLVVPGAANVTFNYIAMQSSGDAVLCGINGPTWFCIRVLGSGPQAGTIDGTFGTGGNFTTSGLLGSFDDLRGAVRDSTDRIVMAGYSLNPGSSILRATVVRLTAGGLMDVH